MRRMMKTVRRTARRALEEMGWLGPVYRDRERRLAAMAGPWRADDEELATPPPLLVAKVAGHADLDAFLEQGRTISSFISALALRSSSSLTRGDVLDFGCGCGRLARFIAPQVLAAGGSYTGTDINEKLVAWCREALPGRYLVNDLAPPVRLEAERFDSLFSVSVFTHLSRERMQAWLTEFWRLLRPGGYALVSFADEARVALADCERPEEPLSATLKQKGFASSTTALEGSNFMSNYVTCSAFKDMASAAGFSVVDVLASDYTGQTLAWAVLQRPSVVTT